MKPGSVRALLLALCIACLASCDQCGPEVVAEIATARGDVQRDHQAYPGQFTHASVSDALHLGDGLRTGPHSAAELTLFPDGKARIEERTLVRFMSERPADGVERLTIEEGVIELDATAIDLELDTGHGVARVKRGSRVRLRASQADDVQLDVLVGRVSIERVGVPAQTAEKGETLVLAAPPAPTPTVAPLEPVAPAPGANDPSASDAADSEDASVDIVNEIDFQLTSLENAVIHAPGLPLDVALPVGACAEARSIEVGRRTVRPEPNATLVSLRMKAGTQRLKVRCGTQTRELTLRVVRDAATQELPRTAPDVDVAADGRRYTVRYQNLLPSIVFSWPKAEIAATYTLFVKRGKGRALRFESAKPERLLKSGELSEGEYTFAFEGGGKRSPDSSLRISFDNTARSAYLAEPVDGSASAGSIRVAGGALVRSDVSIGGVPLAADAQGRFTTLIPHAPNENAIAVRVSHPATGVHYYVRRLR